MGLHACMTCRVMACCEHPAEPPDKQLCASGAGAWGLSPERQCAPHARAAQRRPSPSGHRYVTLLTSKPRTSPLSLSTGHQQPPHVQAASPIPYPGDPGARLVQVLRLARGGQDAAHARAVQRRPGRRAGPVGRQARVDVEHARNAQRHRVHGRAHQRPRAEHACAGAGAVSGDRAPDCPQIMHARGTWQAGMPVVSSLLQQSPCHSHQHGLPAGTRARSPGACVGASCTICQCACAACAACARKNAPTPSPARGTTKRGHPAEQGAGVRLRPLSSRACTWVLASGLGLEMALTADRPLSTACRPGRRRQMLALLMVLLCCMLSQAASQSSANRRPRVRSCDCQ